MPTTLPDLFESIRRYNSDSDLDSIEHAYQFAEKLYSGQTRQTGEPLIQHALEVALILSQLHLDDTTIISGLLHHALDDPGMDQEQLEEEFGEDLASLVSGVTKIGKLAFQSREEEQAENLRKMLLAMAQDLRVVLVKLGDRLHNMRTLKHSPQKDKLTIAQETLDIYAPLANRLGIARIKWELEDLSLFHTAPEVFREIQRKIAQKRNERESNVDEAMDILRKIIEEQQIPATITGRPKHFYSIYRKMERQKIDVDQVFDLAGVRILTKTVADCYSCLGIIHTKYMPIPGRFKDYVAMPKSNLYQSIHTTVVGPRGNPLEVQIRTEEMHRIAEDGIAAHWKYKEEGQKSAAANDEEKFVWLRQLMEWQRDLDNPEDFVESVKIDLFSEEVYVFTPEGDVKALRMGSTPVDFAFAVHTEVGKRCRGARVNKKMVPLKTKLRNGDIVEILTAKNQTPSAYCLKFAVTSKAKNKIRQFIKVQERERSISTAKDMMGRELKKERVDMTQVMRSDFLQKIAKQLSFTNVEDLLAAVGFGRIRLGTLLNPLVERFRPKPEVKESQEIQNTVQRIGSRPGQQAIRVHNMDGIVSRIAKCCSPVPGDPIVGLVTRVRGVSVHYKFCPNVKGASKSKDVQVVDVEWDMNTPESSYNVKLQVRANDRPGLFADVTGTISKLKTKIITGSMESNDIGEAAGVFVLEIGDIHQARRVMKALEKIKGVHQVERVRHGAN